jgi:hypothetical protein
MLSAKPLWTKKLSTSSPGANSKTIACRGTSEWWSIPSDGKKCDACDTVLAKAQLLMEGVTLDLGRRPLQMFVRSFTDLGSGRQATLAIAAYLRRAMFALNVPGD